MLQEAEEEQSAPAGVATIEAEGEFIEIGTQMLRGDRSLGVPSSQRLRREATLCTPGMETWAGSPLSEMLIAWCMYP